MFISQCQAKIPVPVAPQIWQSHWHIFPRQLEVLQKICRAEIMRVPAFKRLSPESRRTLLDQDFLLLPHGSLGLGSARIIENLERDFASEKQAQVAMSLNGEGARVCAHLVRYAQAFSTSDLFITPCSAEKRLIRQFIPNARVEAVPLAVSQDFTPLSAETRSDFRKSLNLNRNEKLVIYAGRLSLQKNVHLLIDLAARLKKTGVAFRLFLIGGVDDLGYPHLGIRPSLAYSRQLARMVEEHSLEDRVEFRGPVSQAELRSFFGACDVHISLTTHFGEDFGYGVAQGLACGAPSVVTRWGGGSDFVNAGAALGVEVLINENGLPVPELESAERAALEILEPRTASAFSEAAVSWSKIATSSDAVLESWQKLLTELRRSQHKSEVLKPREDVLRFHQNRDAKGPLFASSDEPAYQEVLTAYA